MFPINDTQPNRYGIGPVVTVTLIVLNCLVFFWELTLTTSQWTEVVQRFGFTPALAWARTGGGMLSSITGTFLHGGWWHLLGNMLFLWVFGRRVEDACGPTRFLLYYLLAGASADLLTALVQPQELRPGIGASGAIFGVMGAYLVLFPEGRIRILWFIAFIPTWPRIRAVWLVFYYFLIQIPPALDSFLNATPYSTGYWAHLGGFIACLSIFVFLRPAAFARYLSNVAV